MLICISAIVAVIVSCLISPLLLAIPIGLGAKLFKYEIVPGSVSHRWLMVLAGYIGGLIVDKAYGHFGTTLPWWSFLVPAVLFMITGSKPETDINGKSFSFGIASGLFILLLVRWLT